MMLKHFHYDSISAARARSTATLNRQHNRDKQADILRENWRGANWYGLDSFEAVNDALEHGWAEGTARIEALASTIAGDIRRPEGLQRKKYKSSFGDSLDIHAVNCGNLDKAWTTTHKRLSRGTGAVKLVIDIGGNCNVDASVLQWRGVAGAVLARVMEKANYKVQIDAGFGVHDSDISKTLKNVFTVTVKSQNARVNVDRLAASVGLAGFFRVVMFGCIIAECDAQKKNVSSGLGHIQPVVDLLKTLDRITTIFVPETVKDHDTAMTFCNDAIQLLRLA